MSVGASRLQWHAVLADPLFFICKLHARRRLEAGAHTLRRRMFEDTIRPHAKTTFACLPAIHHGHGPERNTRVRDIWMVPTGGITLFIMVVNTAILWDVVHCLASISARRNRA